MLRSIIFFFYIFASNAVIFLFTFWLLVFGRRGAFLILFLWSHNCIKSAKFIVGINYRIIGETLNKPAIYASKHQSAWETAFLLTAITKPIYILKNELFYTPIYGLVLKLAGSIGVKRSRGGVALKEMAKAAKQRIADGHSLIIFPEGTRTIPGAKPSYKPGVAMLYKTLPSIPIVPVSLNSGEFWGRYKFIKAAGLIEVVFHKPINSGLSRDEFMSKLEKVIENN